MDRKTLGIIVLTITATLLAGVVAQGFKDAANAQTIPGSGGGSNLSWRYSDYVVVPMNVSQNSDILAVVDTVTQRILYFEYDINAKQLIPYTKGTEITQELGSR